MKNIKSFKYLHEYEFESFLKNYCYSLDDVKGFSFDNIQHYRGNTLKTYIIYFNDDEYEYFKEVIFKNFNEYHQSRLGFNGSKLSSWYDKANIRMYKLGNKIVRW